MEKRHDASKIVLKNNKQLYHYLNMYYGSQPIARGGLNDHDFYDLDNLLCGYLKEKCIICEIGSWTGMSAILIGARAKNLNGKVYAIDSFKSFGNLEHDSRHYDIQGIMKESLVIYEVSDFVTVIAKDSVEASKDFSNEYFDFIFIDANHSDGAVFNDITSWYPKLKQGGLICGHDYQHESVTRGVNRFFGEVKIVDNIREKSPIWYKLKEKK
ncbi:hypothetical protein LCGC14_1423850 [marine sediment metagenome]|uniref:Methyltransferase domain-containing protein n=1 Tax=marine sediment metagenome TaxID=412755 RepID=A0A0F9KBM0_9ZZZZ